MAAGLSSRTADSPSRPPGPSSQSPRVSQPTMDRLKILYPHVNEDETPLPRSWSPKDKYNFIGLSQNNLRVHYKGKKITIHSIILITIGSDVTITTANLFTVNQYKNLSRAPAVGAVMPFIKFSLSL